MSDQGEPAAPAPGQQQDSSPQQGDEVDGVAEAAPDTLQPDQPAPPDDAGAGLGEQAEIPVDPHASDSGQQDETDPASAEPPAQDGPGEGSRDDVEHPSAAVAGVAEPVLAETAPPPPASIPDQPPARMVGVHLFLDQPNGRCLVCHFPEWWCIDHGDTCAPRADAP